MPLIISAKGSDIGNWRAANDFAATFRQSLLDVMAGSTADEAGTLLNSTILELERLADANDARLAQFRQIMAEVAATSVPFRLKQLVRTFYDVAYAYFGENSSVTAFCDLGNEFLRVLTASLSEHVHRSLGLQERLLPPLSVIALGAAGRGEFSPFCRIQFMIVHESGKHENDDVLEQCGRLFHEGFEACGLLVDDSITPRNQEWRVSFSEWCERLDRGLMQGDRVELIELLRLADQMHLAGESELSDRFRLPCLVRLGKSSAAQDNLVTRILKLSHGIGLMGGIRLDKAGPHSWLFSLFEHALLPLSASITALALMQGATEVGTPQRIRELLGKRSLDVEHAERLLGAWHLLSGYRFAREALLHPDWSSPDALYLNVEPLSHEAQEVLKDTLEAVGHLKRHVGIIFNGMWWE